MIAQQIKIVIPGKPVSWKRLATRGGRHFVGAEERQAMRTIALLLLGAGAPAAPDEAHAWAVGATFMFTDYRNHDVDRLLSLILDAAQGILYANDSQIFRLDPTEKLLGCHIERSIVVFRCLGRLPSREPRRRAAPRAVGAR